MQEDTSNTSPSSQILSAEEFVKILNCKNISDFNHSIKWKGNNLPFNYNHTNGSITEFIFYDIIVVGDVVLPQNGDQLPPLILYRCYHMARIVLCGTAIQSITITEETKLGNIKITQSSSIGCLAVLNSTIGDFDIQKSKIENIEIINSRIGSFKYEDSTTDVLRIIELLRYDNQSVKQKFHSAAQTPATRLYN